MDDQDSMDGPRGVVFAMLVAFGIFVFSGVKGSRKLASGLTRATGTSFTLREPTAGERSIDPQALLGWAVLFVVLIALADIDSTAQLATAFAFLILVTILLAFGKDAFDNITHLLGGETSEPLSGGKGQIAV